MASAQRFGCDLCIVGIASLALIYFIPAPPSTITIAMAFKGSSYERWALSYQERLARSHVTLNLHYTDGPLDNIRLIKDQSSGVDVAFLFGGLTNSADTQAVLVRKTLHPELIYLLAQTLSQEHNGAGIFQRTGDFPTVTDPEFPVAQTALDFYKNGPPLLNKYLPSWIVPHAQRLFALLLATGAIVFPVFSLAPKLFKSFIEYRLGSMYRRLRTIEESLQNAASVAEVSTLEAELARIDREISIFGIPKGHSDLFFSIKSHLDVVRVRLSLRRAELQSQMSKAA